MFYTFQHSHMNNVLTCRFRDVTCSALQAGANAFHLMTKFYPGAAAT